MARSTLLLVLVLARVLAAAPLAAQAPGPRHRSESVQYRSTPDSTVLAAELELPEGRGPFPGVVLLSIAGTDPIVERLTALGYAVLVPVRRGFVSVEPLLQATYQNLADDDAAAVAYLRARSDVRDEPIAVIGQGDDAPPAMMMAAQAAASIPLVLLSPPAFAGSEVFRLEQHGLAERRGARPAELDSLDRYTGEISRIVLTELSPYARAIRLEELMASSSVRLPYNAAFPTDVSRVHFFSAPLWFDRLSFDPAAVLARLHGPVLLLVGDDDPDVDVQRYVPAVQGPLQRAPTKDAIVCLLPDRTRHTFTDGAVAVVAGWLAQRVPAPNPAPSALDRCRKP